MTKKDTQPEHGIVTSKPVIITSLLKELTLVAMAGPAALGVIGQISEKFKFSESIERIVLNVRVVTRAFWNLLFSWLLIAPPIPIDALTIVILVTIPFLFQRIFLPRAEKVDLYLQISTSASIAAIFIIFLSGSGYLLIQTIMSVIALTWVIGIWELAWKRSLHFAFAGIFLVPFYILFLCVLEANISGSDIEDGGSNIDYLIPILPTALEIIAFILVFCLAANSIRVGARGPLYAVLVAGGIWAIDWMARSGRPALDAWLSSLGT
ncbi:hypothetical protein [Mesorhizobium sp.]|uniref:hypothetical protein n=1 Tax=Mesorhizobium sp. TaxID=1871066 RepID=UPI000FE7AF6A|nr:hypothetical protein [Mesorhizobium sp.]RWP51091.1 MAG: hypothetical protein EOR05_04005 [Mesorhizobium sp.]